jgi:hypothetical protein
MIRWEICLQKEGDFELAINKKESSDIRHREISLICENTRI